MNIKSLKFGSKTMENASSILACADVVKKNLNKYQLVVTVSAISGITDELQHIISLIKKQKPRLTNKRLSLIEAKHKKILQTLVKDNKTFEIAWQQNFLPLLEKLRAILYGTSLVGDITDKTQARIYAFGEKLAGLLMMQALEKQNIKSLNIESEKIIKTNSNYLHADIHSKSTETACRKILTPILRKNIIPIVAGSIGKDTHGNTTRLKYSGSDYTASLIALSLHANAMEIWTNVNGILSADPNLVHDVISWHSLGIQVVSEMAYSGAKIVHPSSIAKIVAKNIPVYVFNLCNQQHPGTKIISQSTSGLKGIVINPNNVIIHIDDPSMLEEVGLILNVSNVMQTHHIPIDVCATSETSFTFSITQQDYSKKLHKDLSNRFMQVKVFKNITKVSLIGLDITKNTTLLADVFSLCNKNGISLKTVSIGASFKNITLLVDEKDGEKLLRLLHDQLMGSDPVGSDPI